MAAVASVHTGFEVESPFDANVLQLEPPSVETSSRKKSPEASSPASRWPWKYQIERSDASVTLNDGDSRMQLPPSTSALPALELVAVNKALPVPVV